MLTAAFGAGSASAAEGVLCKTESSPCPSSDIEPAGSWFSAAGGELSIKNGFTDLSCYNFALGSKTLAESGWPLEATGEGGPFGLCLMGTGSSCSSVTASKTNNRLYASKTPYLLIGTTAERLSVSFACKSASGTLTECTYTADGPIFVVVSKVEAGVWRAASGKQSMTKTAGNAA